MNNEVIIGLFTLGGAAIGGLCAIIASKIDSDTEKMKRDIRVLSSQVKSYWLLEKEYLSQISSLTGTPQETLMKSSRKTVENNGNDYPCMTAKEANDILKKY